MQNKTDGQTSKLRTIGGYFVLAGLIIFILVGVFTVGRFTIGILAKIHFGFWTSLSSWTHDYVWNHPDGWITAIATALLFWATLALTRSTRVQVAGDAPLLRYALYLDDPGNSVPAGLYNEFWRKEDESMDSLRAYLSAGDRFIRLDLVNEQQKTFGVAVDVVITCELLWGALDNTTPHPYGLKRDVAVPALGAAKTITGPIFNTGTLPNFLVKIADVRYVDIADERRRVSYGAGQIWQRLGGVSPITTETVFKPTKKELGR